VTQKGVEKKRIKSWRRNRSADLQRSSHFKFNDLDLSEFRSHQKRILNRRFGDGATRSRCEWLFGGGVLSNQHASDTTLFLIFMQRNARAADSVNLYSWHHTIALTV
jgi:hypothetical protein